MLDGQRTVHHLLKFPIRLAIDGLLLDGFGLARSVEGVNISECSCSTYL